ncbi:MAG: DegT/DnrJ/EryC1/StrS family aminotransferase [Armatimonadota bacterium]|nr:DegT/DnrJ/EryC1/StrS family aminotransferase [Armatimonadota bacterium]MDR7429380.1 DegT/DnrJ/EryC1/StrS family aminotransferase [Armatimonadota bacterium]MDR7432626.1 DegT/DnrJ/EryC1/StrS family aminotransferase [Armatimonadota bacterium]MDR7514172.1 DegT/DnrJ/EryC1/StrS family aminotransferase [Armatimonadota bacterium]MDR7565467.1 DegT/DnrJ/EryC1/StrS family aminotransferase [Armatimonadota bacterium]
MSAEVEVDWVPIARPVVTEADRRRVLEVLSSGKLSSGEWVERFEAAFAAYVQVPHAVATSSGTAGLEVLLEALGVGPGDEVVVPAFTFAATANAVVHRGARPVFVDIDPVTFNLDPSSVEDALRRHPRVRGIVAVHLYGLPAAVDVLAELADRHGVWLVEDAAQAHGAALRGRRVGGFGVAAVFSFYPTKNMTTGEGGMVVARDPQLARRVRLLVHQGQSGPYRYEVVGHNYRMTDLAAALGLGQLEKLDERNAARRRNAQTLTEVLRDLPGILPPTEPEGYFHVYHQYTVRARRRDELSRHLRARGVETRVYYPEPVPHTEPYRRLGYTPGGWPQAERASGEVLSLPVHPALTEGDLRRVVDAVREFARQVVASP